MGHAQSKQHLTNFSPRHSHTLSIDSHITPFDTPKKRAIHSHKSMRHSHRRRPSHALAQASLHQPNQIPRNATGPVSPPSAILELVDEDPFGDSAAITIGDSDGPKPKPLPSTPEKFEVSRPRDGETMAVAPRRESIEWAHARRARARRSFYGYGPMKSVASGSHGRF